MAESPSEAPTPTSVPDTETASHYWCYQCNKRVSVETIGDGSDIICNDCKNGFVEVISAAPSFISDQDDDSSFGSQFLQMLRIISHATREVDAPARPPPDHPQSDDDFLRIELFGWDNDEDEADEDDDDDDDDDANQNEQNRNEGEHGGEEGEDRSDNENEDNRDEDDEEELRRRRRNILRLQIRDFATRARRRNRILDWAEIQMGLEENSIEFRLGVPESDRYIGNPEDYVDAAGYEALLQNLAESDGGRRGAPPAAKSAVSALPTVVIISEEETVVCAICKDMVNVGEKTTKLPCGHGYHGECIVSWLGSRNSCPVCRFELPTDDPDYEEEKRRKGVAATAAATSFVGASGSGGGNSGSD